MPAKLCDFYVSRLVKRSEQIGRKWGRKWGRKSARSLGITTVALAPAITLFIAIGAIGALHTTSVNAKTWECGERSNLPQEGKNYCAAGDFRQSDINLKKVLAKVLEMHQSSYGDSSSLNDAQRAFEAYRDNQCTAENKRIEDQSFHSMIVSQCRTRHTNLRINELRRMLEISKQD